MSALQPRPSSALDHLGAYTAPGIGKRVTLAGDTVTVSVRLLRWWSMSSDRTEGRPRQVSFPVWAIRRGYVRTASWWRPGLLYLDVPDAGDPWARRTEKMRRRGVYPKPRAYKIRFRKSRQPWFVLLAEQIGVEQPEED